MRNILCLVLFLSFASSFVYAQNPTPRQKIDAVVQNLFQEGNWKSAVATSKLEAVLSESQDTSEIQTAKVLLAFYLSENVTSVQRKDPSERIRVLCDQVLKGGIGTWQESVARVLLVAERDFSGDRIAEISMATNALAEIDFEAIEKVSDPAWLAIRKALGNQPYALREALKMALANALCEEDQLAEARAVQQTMADTKYAKVIDDRIVLAEKARQERHRLAVEHSQSPSSSVP